LRNPLIENVIDDEYLYATTKHTQICHRPSTNDLIQMKSGSVPSSAMGRNFKAVQTVRYESEKRR